MVGRNKSGSFYEFFAGGGMARAGLGIGWNCLFANDFDEAKCRSYRTNWGLNEIVAGDVAAIAPADLPGEADLVWASFPCQDLSLAGAGAGLKGARSGAFWPFWRLMQGLAQIGRSPKLIVLENVYGALTSHGGRDFAALGAAFAKEGYRFGALVIDGVQFTPQSRPRLFILAVRTGVVLPAGLCSVEPEKHWHPGALTTAYEKLPPAVKANWIWWRLPAPAKRNTALSDLIENDGAGLKWHTPTQTRALIALMSPLHRVKLSQAKASGRRTVGTVYRRTRKTAEGARQQRAEVRFDGIAGCLRTPAGGSSRQTVMIVEGDNVRSRLISAREAARLMGLPDDYVLPKRYSAAYHLVGDGVVVPVVRHIAQYLLEPILRPRSEKPASRNAA